MSIHIRKQHPEEPSEEEAAPDISQEETTAERRQAPLQGSTVNLTQVESSNNNISSNSNN